MSGAFEILAAPMSYRILFHVESAGRRSAAGRFTRAAPDAVPHVGVGRVEDAGLGEIAQEALVLFDLLVAARQVQRHFLHVVDVAVADVPDFQAGGFDSLFEANEVFQRRPVPPVGMLTYCTPSCCANCRSSSLASRGNLQRHLDARGQRLELRGRLSCNRTAD